ncbi:translesion error-prone DNA polymerase V autoproteolytic subunit [Mesonia sp. MT50]|uniref:Translesion error-prone DNA polymerase V autoproteolytic subunit n=1 Tax=Mesonia profundi TaxID=3070998 RepID=A0ABU1A2T8_9FLAO|nr:translesion error-prone DNA polymerase V autoproteolytic subunit [Mesonia profundi]MDQ7918017.1 translesion error-prone DNA polymerase V autoproteolytic subunit [Mesonia profundi]
MVTSLIELRKIKLNESLVLPLAEKINAGFPSPAEDFLDLSIDLNKEFIKHPDATFFGKVSGDSMIDAGLDNGDLLIIDKSLEPKNNSIAVCFLDGEFTVKRVLREEDKLWLVAENKNYQPIPVYPENDFIIWGVVTTVIKKIL